MSSSRGGLLAVLGSVCWGLSGSMGQYLFTAEHMDSRWLVPIRLGGAGVLLLIYCAFRYGPAFLFAPWKRREHAAELLVYGLLGVSACQFFYFLTIQLSNAGTATILQDLSPLCVLAVLCFWERRRPNMREIICILLALGGVFLITTHGRLGTMAVTLPALMTGLLSAVCVAVYTLAPRNILDAYPVALLQGWSFLLGGAAFALIFHPWSAGYHPTPAGWFGIAFVILVGNILAFLLFMTGVREAGPEKSNLYSFAEPLTAALISTAVLGSSFGIWDAAGFLMVFAMMLLLSSAHTVPEGDES